MRKYYDEYRPAHLKDGLPDDGEYTAPLRNPGPGPDDDYSPDDELAEWLQRAIEAEEERLWIEELAKQHEEEMARKRGTPKI